MSKDIINLIAVCLFAEVLITWLLADIAEYLVVRRLRRYHPELWARLSSPGRKMWGRRGNSLSPWLKRRGYKSVEDAGLVRLCRRVRIFSVARVPCFFAGFIPIMILVICSGHLH